MASPPAYKHFIGGTFVDSLTSTSTFEVLAPASGEIVGVCQKASLDDVDAAVQSARAAYEVWSKTPPGTREKVLLDCATAVDLHGKEMFLDVLVDESGSTVAKAMFEIKKCATLLRVAAGMTRRLYGKTFPNDKPNRISMVIREPMGVIAVVSPYNGPLVLLSKMAILAIGCANTVVAKPSSETPIIALKLAQLLHEKGGLPAGVFNIITGSGREVGSPLVAHKDVKCCAFTGSSGVGSTLGQLAVKDMKRVMLELGGKNPLIVCADIAAPGARINVQKAAEQAVLGSFFHGGQICMASTRIIVERAVAKEFIPALVSCANALKPSNDLRDPTTSYGPVINRGALEKVIEHQKAALDAGAKILCGGSLHEGLVYQPTYLIDVPTDNPAWCEETFGPLAIVQVVDTFEDALASANNTAFGLSAGILTNDVTKGMRAATEIRAGSVHVGIHSFQSDAMSCVGGYGISGLGRGGGDYSLEMYTEQKWVSIEMSESPIIPSFQTAGCC